MSGPPRATRAYVAERRTKAIAMKMERHTWGEIAEVLGYKTGAAACQDVGRALKERLAQQREGVDELREQELSYLAGLAQEVRAVMERKHYVAQKGAIVYGPEGVCTHPRGHNGQDCPDKAPVPLEDSGPILAGIDRLLKIAERRAKLLGLDAPIKIDTRSVYYVVEGVDMAKLQ